MVVDHVFTQLKDKYKDYASWAIWTDPDDITDVSGIEDSKDALHPEWVFVGLKASGKDDGRRDAWRSFHVHKGNDSKLMRVLCGNDFSGAYLTDVVKGIEEFVDAKFLEEADSNIVYKEWKSNPQLRERCIRLLSDELTLIQSLVIGWGRGSYPHIIAMGDVATRILTDIYSECLGNPKYSEVLVPILKESGFDSPLKMKHFSRNLEEDINLSVQNVSRRLRGGN